jgi:hypothetical protein
MTLGHHRLGKVELKRIRAALLKFGSTATGKAFFQETGYEDYAAITPEDIQSLAPYVALTKSLLGHPS